MKTVFTTVQDDGLYHEMSISFMKRYKLKPVAMYGDHDAPYSAIFFVQV